MEAAPGHLEYEPAGAWKQVIKEETKKGGDFRRTRDSH